jgi:hypothetical protein
MAGAAEAQLNKLGLRIEEFEFGRHDEPDVNGFASLEWSDLDHTTYMARLFVRPGTSASDREGFAAWCLGAVDRWVTSGPEVDGWQRRESDAGWQLWCRQVMLPSMD